MSNTKKTIQINPELFKFNGNKTRKNLDKKEKPIVPFIKASNLKSKFLNRIKEHKNKEIQEKKNDSESNIDNDEFYGALKYLSEIPNKQKKDHLYHNKTIKKDTSPQMIPHVELELPPELQEQEFSQIQQRNPKEQMVLNYRVDNDVPHGCLRGGQKPTYRTWQHLTRKKNEVDMNINNTNQITTTREERLQMIKTKLKNLEKETVFSERKEEPVQQIHTVDFSQKIEPMNTMSQPIQPNTNTTNRAQATNEPFTATPSKKMIKKTIRKKYTLGKSNIYRRVGVLIKDKQTRKNILNAHKELKKTPITDIKNYLKQHGIIKVGSSAPNDVLRKTFEYSRLAGEIHNTNKDTLLHNFMNDEQNENK